MPELWVIHHQRGDISLGFSTVHFTAALFYLGIVSVVLLSAAIVK